MHTKRNQSPVDIEKYSFDIFNHLFLFLAVRSSDGDFPKCRLTYLPKKERFSKPKRYAISFIE